MNPIAPRELPKKAREQVKQILELAKIDEDIKKLDEGKSVQTINKGDV